MGAQSTGAAATGFSVCRLVVLGLTLAGIVAMHGLASTDAAGQHQSALDMTMASGTHETPSMLSVPVDGDPPTGMPAVDAPLADMIAASGGGLVLMPGKQHEGHELMAACVVILLGLLAALVLSLLGIGHGLDRILTPTRCWFSAAAARAPPRPLHLSLCVFRN